MFKFKNFTFFKNFHRNIKLLIHLFDSQNLEKIYLLAAAKLVAAISLDHKF